MQRSFVAGERRIRAAHAGGPSANRNALRIVVDRDITERGGAQRPRERRRGHEYDDGLPKHLAMLAADLSPVYVRMR